MVRRHRRDDRPSARVLVILDGAPEPIQPWPTTLEAARTPTLDALCRHGAVARLRTTPEGLAPGSETGIPTLLGAEPDGAVGRGAIEAASAGVDVPEGLRAWRIDLRGERGRRATEQEVHLVWPALRAQLPRHCLTPLRGHRLLAIGARHPQVMSCAGFSVEVWPAGVELRPTLDERTTVVAGPGAAAGVGRLLGARVVEPAGATGDLDTDLRGKAATAIGALRHGGAESVIVHVGGADEAAHRTDREGKRLFLEAVDEQLLGPLAAAAHDHDATLAITADHGTCPWTGRHDGQPVPAVLNGPRVGAAGPSRLTERAVERAPVFDSPWAILQAAEVAA